MTTTTDDGQTHLETDHDVEVVVRFKVFGRQENILKAVSKVRNDLRVSMHQPDLEVGIAGIDRKRPIKTLPLEIPKHLT